MRKPDKTPAAVREGLERYGRQHEGVNVAQLERDLSWDGLLGCYYFYRGDLFHGVELDGTVHT